MDELERVRAQRRLLEGQSFEMARLALQELTFRELSGRYTLVSDVHLAHEKTKSTVQLTLEDSKLVVTVIDYPMRSMSFGLQVQVRSVEWDRGDYQVFAGRKRCSHKHTDKEGKRGATHVNKHLESIKAITSDPGVQACLDQLRNVHDSPTTYLRSVCASPPAATRQ